MTDRASPGHVEVHHLDEFIQLRGVIESVPDPIFCKDRQGRYVLTNHAHSQLLRIPHGSSLGKTVLEIPGLCETARMYHQDDRQVLESGQPIVNHEQPFSWPDGSRGWYLISKYPLRNAAGEVVGLVGIARNITDRREAERKLHEERQMLRTVIDAVADAIFFKDPDGRFVLVNAAYQNLFNLNPETIVGKCDAEIPQMRGFAELYAADDRHVLESGLSLINREEPFRQADGSQGWFLTSKFPLPDSDGKIVGLVGIARDITEMRRATEELRTLQRKLQETQKLESLGVMAGGIAHDFNNLLTGVMGNAALAAMDLPPGSPVLAYIDQIETAATRAAELCKQMLAYSGKGRFAVRALDLNSVIVKITDLLRVSISKSTALTLDLAPGLPAVEADATQIRQVVMNVVINASEALGEHGGTVRLSTGLMRGDSAYFASGHLSPDRTEGDFVFLEVADDGRGMPPKVRERIFDPFFTTKFTGRGLGLAAVLGIVRGHRGAVRVESELGRGTTFRVLLPALDRPAEIEAPPEVRAQNWRGHGIALVIDDEMTVRTTVSQMLRVLGFEVQTAPGGVEGVDAFRRAPESFAVVLLDLTMPRLDGAGVFHILDDLCPGVRVVMMSGYNEIELAGRFGRHAPAAFLQKPFRVSALREKLEAVLG